MKMLCIIFLRGSQQVSIMFLKFSSGMDGVKNVLHDNIAPILQWVLSGLCDNEAFFVCYLGLVQLYKSQAVLWTGLW